MTEGVHRPGERGWTGRRYRQTVGFQWSSQSERWGEMTGENRTGQWQASDGRWYSADEEPGWAEPSPYWSPPKPTGESRPAPRWLRPLAFAAVALLVVVAGVGIAVVAARNTDPVPPVEGAIAAREHFALDILRCPAEAGGRSSGSIRNRADVALSFRITIPYVAADGSETLLGDVVVVRLAPDEIARWEMAEAPEGTVDCNGADNLVRYESVFS